MIIYYQDPQVTIYHGDSREWRGTEEIDLLLSDPQYGIGFDVTAQRVRNSGLNWGAGNTSDHNPEWRPLQNGDRTPFDPTPWLGFESVILWGANNYASRLPDSRGWIVWDKLGEKTPTAFGDCELAWSNLNASIRIHRQLWRGIVREGEENLSRERKSHPSQKPIALMQFCIQFADKARKKRHELVFDPYMGSGATLRAAKNLGKKAIGIELEEVYCERAAKRMLQDNLALQESA